MSTTDHSFRRYVDERYDRDWLVELVMVPAEDPEQKHVTLEWIGKLSVFAWSTNTRLLAALADPDVPAYELWFSFDSKESKRSFLGMVREEGYAHPEGEGEFQPADPEALRHIRNLQPLGLVFPKEDLDRITTSAMVTANAMNIKLSEINLA